jgi:hypothetical protein
VAADEGELGGLVGMLDWVNLRVEKGVGEGRCGYQRPVAVDGVEVGVAYAGVLDVYEDFVWAGLLDWDLLVLDGAAGLLDDLRPLLFRYLAHDDGVNVLSGSGSSR